MRPHGNYGEEKHASGLTALWEGGAAQGALLCRPALWTDERVYGELPAPKILELARGTPAAQSASTSQAPFRLPLIACYRRVLKRKSTRRIFCQTGWSKNPTMYLFTPLPPPPPAARAGVAPACATPRRSSGRSVRPRRVSECLRLERAAGAGDAPERARPPRPVAPAVQRRRRA